MLLWRLASLWSMSSTINFTHIKNSWAKWMRVECTLNSYSDQFTFSLISFQYTRDCVYVQEKKHLQPKKEVDVFPRRTVAEHRFIPFPCASWFTVMEGENGPGSIPTAHIVTPFLLKAAEIILAMEASRIIKSLPDFSKFLPLSAYFLPLLARQWNC